MFCQLEVLRYCLPSSVPRILDELPESLDETYERILKEIKKSNQEHALRLLQCLVVAVRPLTVGELAEVLVFDFDEDGIPKPNPDWRLVGLEDQEEAIMSTCSNLITIVDDRTQNSRVVQFSHFTVKEFLTANRLAEPIRDVSRYHIRLDAAHTVLVRACLGSLFQPGPSCSQLMIRVPLFLYAAQYWDTHARFEDVSSRIKEGIRRLFDADQPYFGRWVLTYRYDIGYVILRSVPFGPPPVVPIDIASRLGIYDAAEYIIAEHPEQMEDHVTPMHAAAETGHANILTLLLEHGANVDVRDTMRQAPLHRASRGGKLEAGQILLDHGADIHARMYDESTPLHVAASRGCVDFARMLLERGAEINPRDHVSNTPLHDATSTGKPQVVRLLLEYGADVNTRNQEGETPSEFASRIKQRGVLELLSKHGVTGM